MIWGPILSGAAAGGTMFGLEKLFGGSKSGSVKYTSSPEEREMYQYLLDLMQRKPNLPTKEVAGMTPTEIYGQTLLEDYSKSGYPLPYITGLSELLKTIKGGYDPATSKFYKSMRKEITSTTDEAQNRLSRTMQKRGASAQGVPRAAIKLEEGRASDIDTLLGSLTETERDRIFQAIPILANYSELAEQMPLRRLGAIQQFGALPREIEQMINEAAYGKEYEEAVWPWKAAGLLSGTTSSLLPSAYMTSGYPSSGTASQFMSALAPIFAASFMQNTPSVNTNPMISSPLYSYFMNPSAGNFANLGGLQGAANAANSWLGEF